MLTEIINFIQDKHNVKTLEVNQEANSNYKSINAGFNQHYRQIDNKRNITPNIYDKGRTYKGGIAKDRH